MKQEIKFITFYKFYITAINRLLHIDKAPTFVFTSVPSVTTIEDGSEVVKPQLVISFSDISGCTVSKIDLLKNDNALATINYVDGTTYYSYMDEVTLSTNTTYSMIVTYNFGNGDLTTNPKYINFKFISASYYGIVDDLVNDEATIMALTKSVKATQKLTYSNITMENKRICYAYPSSLADLTSAVDVNGFNLITSFTKTTMTINNISYKVYTLTDTSSATNGKFIFS